MHGERKGKENIIMKKMLLGVEDISSCETFIFILSAFHHQTRVSIQAQTKS